MPVLLSYCCANFTEDDSKGNGKSTSRNLEIKTSFKQICNLLTKCEILTGKITCFVIKKELCSS